MNHITGDSVAEIVKLTEPSPYLCDAFWRRSWFALAAR
jgi:hypothetical protein